MTIYNPVTAHLKQTEILWDTWGVPHIFAKDNRSLFYAFGWSQMQNHGNLILKLYAQARGRAAEYWGEEYLTSDQQVRTFGIPSLAQQWYAEQKPELRGYLDAFAQGMNAYQETHSDQIDPVAKSVFPVTAEDVLAHVIRLVHFTFITETAGIRTTLENWQKLGSNAWAISPQHSASGHAMLLANPHLPWSDRFLFFETQLVSPNLDIYGATLVGLPILTFAFNDYLGWTHTVNTIRAADLYELSLTSEGGYRWEEGVKDFEVEKQVIKVKQADGNFREEVINVLNSVHGAVIAKNGNKALALRVAGLEQSGIFEQYWDMARAQNLAEFESILKRLQIPLFTVLYADRDGHILHLFNGQVPIRREVEQPAVLAGDTAQTLWTETHDYVDLPKVIDPPSGWLQNANDPPWTTTFPQVLNPEDFASDIAPQFMQLRAQNSAKMLANRGKISLADMIRYKHSTHVELADRVLENLIREAKQGSELARRSAQILESWNRETLADSQGAVLFALWAEEMDFPKAFAIPWNPQNPLTTPRGLAHSQEAVTVLEKVADQVIKNYGKLEVAWGDVFRLRYGQFDLPANGGSNRLGIFRVLEFFPVENHQFEANFGDSYIAAIEFANPVRAKVLNSYGNASQPGSIHVGDQLPLMVRQELREVWRDRNSIESHLESRQVF